MQYREWAPIPQLRACVDRVWTLEGAADASGEPQPVLPDGRPELVMHFGEPFTLVSEAGYDVRQSSSVFAGQLRSQLLLRPSGRTAIVGIRFHPYGAAGLLAVPQHRLAGAPTALDDISPGLRHALESIDADGSDLARAANAVQSTLARVMSPARVDPRVAHAVNVIARAGGRLSVDRLALHTGMTRRHLERRFLDQVGLTPKRLARITRFQRALRVLDEAGPSPGTRTAAECGYADQPHFIRDFRDLAGCAPSEHLLGRAELTGFFIASSA